MLAQNCQTALEPAGIVPDRTKKSAPRVLVVDDEWLVRWSVSEALRARGFEVDEAADAASAMRVFDFACDLVLLDLHLPDADDLCVLTWMRATSPSVPVIMMTAFATREIIEDATALGAAVIAKPFDLDDLTDAVEHALDRRIY